MCGQEKQTHYGHVSDENVPGFLSYGRVCDDAEEHEGIADDTEDDDESHCDEIRGVDVTVFAYFSPAGMPFAPSLARFGGLVVHWEVFVDAVIVESKPIYYTVIYYVVA